MAANRIRKLSQKKRTNTLHIYNPTDGRLHPNTREELRFIQATNRFLLARRSLFSIKTISLLPSPFFLCIPLFMSRFARMKLYLLRLMFLFKERSLLSSPLSFCQDLQCEPLLKGELLPCITCFDDVSSESVLVFYVGRSNSYQLVVRRLNAYNMWPSSQNKYVPQSY